MLTIMIGVPLRERAFAPVVGENGEPQLLMSASFSIDLRKISIEGADGPAPANHTLLFDVNFVLTPAREN